MNQQGVTKKQGVEPSCQLTHCHLLNVILYSKIYVHRQCWFGKFDNQVKFYSCGFNKRGNVDKKWQELQKPNAKWCDYMPQLQLFNSTQLHTYE